MHETSADHTWTLSAVIACPNTQNESYARHANYKPAPVGVNNNRSQVEADGGLVAVAAVLHRAGLLQEFFVDDLVGSPASGTRRAGDGLKPSLVRHYHRGRDRSDQAT